MSDVFISYAREDQDFVRRLSLALREKNRETWIDWEGILPSTEWRQEILSAIDSANTIVQIISPYSAKSKVCADEIIHACKNNKRIVPVVRQDVDENELPDAIRDRHWVFFRETDDFDTGLANLIRALDTDIEWVRSHTRLLTRAQEWERHGRDSSYALRGSDLRGAESALTSRGHLEPQLLPLQIDFILASRKATARRTTLSIGAGALALVAIVVFTALYFFSRKESALNLAANFREMGISELENGDPLAAEVFFAKALSINDNVGARERLIEARTQSPRLLWINAPGNASLLATSNDGVLFVEATPLEVSVWNTVERRQVRLYRTRGDSQEKPLAAFGPQHRLLAVGTANRVSVWDLLSASEQPIESISTRSDVSSLSINSDGSTIIVGEASGIISSWRIGGHESPDTKFIGHSDRVTGTVVSGDDRVLISGSWDETAKVWDLQTGTNTQTFTGHDDALLCVAISPDGELVASAGWDDTIWLWDRRTGKGVRALTGHKGSILALAFSPDGKWLVSGSEDRTARLWEVARGRHVLTFPGHSGDVTSVAFLSADGQQELLTGDTTGIVRLWDLSVIGQRKELTTLRGHGAVTMIDFNPIEPLIASSSIDKSVDVWNFQTGKLVRTFAKQPNNVSAVAFSPDGKHLASAAKNSEVRIWDLATGESRALIAAEQQVNIRHIVFSSDGEFLAGGSDDGELRIWNVKTTNVEHLFAAHTAKIQGLSFSPDGSLLASSSEDSTVKLWSTKDWKLKSTLIGHKSGVYEIAFSPDGKLLLSGSDDKTVRLWDVVSGKEVISPIEHKSPVWAVGFDDNDLIATGSEDSTIQLWKVSTSGSTINLRDHFVLRISDGPIWWLKFHRDSSGESLGIASQDRTVRVLHMSALDSLFSNSELLEGEAQEQGGLLIGQGLNGEPQIVPMQPENFVAK